MRYVMSYSGFRYRLCWILVVSQILCFTIIWIYSTKTSYLNSSLTQHTKYIRNGTTSYSELKITDKDEPFIYKCDIRLRSTEICTEILNDGKGLNVSRRMKEMTLGPECSLKNLVQRCDIFKIVHGYVSHSISEEEISFPLAYSIKLHKQPEQAEQLLRTIYRRHNVYCIYIDNKASVNTYEMFVNLSKCFDNVFVLEQRVSVVYASIYHVFTELQCMMKLLNSNVKWKYYINLTGQEFPLKTNSEIVQILKSLNGANDVESFKFPYYLRYRYQKTFKILKRGMVRENKTKERFKYNIEMRKGSAYGMFKREFVQFVLNDDIARDFITWTADTLSPEETVWATLNALPWAPGGYKIETKHSSGTFLSRAMIWDWDKIGCSGKYVRHVCVFGVHDLPWLSFRNEIFANKFDASIDSLVLSCLEEVIRNRTLFSNHNKLNWTFYKNIPQSRIYRNLTEDILSSSALSAKKAEWLKDKEH